MQLRNYVRNRFGKCDVPGNTIQRIRQGFERLALFPEYRAYPVSDHLYWSRVWIDSIRIVCEGKGVTPELAEASALAELAERLSAGMFYPVFEEQVRFNMPALYGTETSRFLNFEWMKGYVRGHQDEVENPLRIEDLLINETYLSDVDIEEIKACEMCRHWVDGYSILTQEKHKIPVQFVAYIHGSNGIAAGNTLEEAIIQATCEIFERYVQIRVIKPENEVPTIDPDSLENPFLLDMIRFFEKQNVKVVLKDLSLDGIFPVSGVFYTNTNLRPDRLEYRVLIPGASMNSDEGLTRCFTEGVQGRTTLKKPRAELDHPVAHGTAVNDYYMLMRCGVALKDISFLEKGEKIHYKRRECQDIYAEIHEIEEVCRHLNTELFVLDHTHPVLDFPVVRVVIPGVSDFLPYLKPDVLVAESTRPSSAYRGGEFIEVMKTFFRKADP